MTLHYNRAITDNFSKKNMSIIQTGLVPHKDADRVKNITIQFQEIFGRAAKVVVRVPGRLVIIILPNLISAILPHRPLKGTRLIMLSLSF